MYNDFFKSNNNDYIGTIEPVGDDIVNINIISSLTRNISYCVTLPGSFGGERFSVSDDGDLVASAVYSDYGKGKVSIYSNKEKKVIFETALFKRIDWIDFYNLSVVMIGEKIKLIFTTLWITFVKLKTITVFLTIYSMVTSYYIKKMSF